MNYKVNDIIVGKVTGITKYGIFMSFDNDYVGMVHISEISYDYIKDIHEYINIGDEIEVKIIDIVDSKKLQLTMKNISDIKVHKRKTKIKETIHGFETLRSNLPLWIDKKIKK